MAASSPRGRIHSYESCAIGDGPGIRFAVFLQGCPLRCRYCHNPDTWKLGAGREVSVEEVMSEIRKYRSYMRASNGGVTLSGGEPLAQAEFAAALLAECKREGIHTAIDTAYPPASSIRELLEVTDLVLHDLKSIDPEQHRWLTGAELEPALELARRLGELGKPTWIQHVLVPGITDREDLLERLASFVATLPTVAQVEILPFHQLGAYKWAELGLEYSLADTPPASAEQVARATAIFERHGLRTD